MPGRRKERPTFVHMMSTQEFVKQAELIMSAMNSFGSRLESFSRFTQPVALIRTNLPPVGLNVTSTPYIKAIIEFLDQSAEGEKVRNTRETRQPCGGECCAGGGERDSLQSIKPRDIHERGKEMPKHDLIVGRFPVLIATKGLPCTGKSIRAHSVARVLRCPVLNFDDIRNCTQQTYQYLLLSSDPEVAASAHDHLDELSHQALLQFASTQLLLGHSVLVDSPLSRPEAMHQLMDLANSNRVPLIIIECVAISKSTWCSWLMEQDSGRRESSSAFYSKLEVRRIPEGRHQSFDGETNNIVPWLVIDTAQNCYRPGVVDHLSDVVLKFILLYKQNLGSKCNATASSSHESGRDGEKLKRHFSHSHPLTFVPEQHTGMDSPSAAAPQCRICLLPITASSYNCPQCSFVAHESCIELPQYTSHFFHIHPLGLCVQSYNSNEPEESEDEDEDTTCIVCNGTNKGPIYRCWQCYGVFVHHECAQLSHELKHPCHDHPLKLETYNLFPSRNKFTCRACGHKGGNISYGCSACKLKIHITCALELPLEVEYTCAQFHPLVLASPPKDDSNEYYCDVCEEERHGDYWIYYCHSCEFHAHLNCVNPEIQAYDVAEAKNPRDDESDKDSLESNDDDEEEEEEEEEEENPRDDGSDKDSLESNDADDDYEEEGDEEGEEEED